MIYAQIKNNVVAKLVVADNAGVLPNLIIAENHTQVGDELTPDGKLPRELWAWHIGSMQKERFTETSPPPSDYTQIEPPLYSLGWDESSNEWLVDADKALADAKEIKAAAADAKTNALSLQFGFRFRDARFSLEPAAEKNWGVIINSLNLMTGLLAQGQITQQIFLANFPVGIETIEKIPYALSGPADVVDFWQAYLGAQRDPDNPLAAGRILRARIMTAQSLAELDEIIDDRA